MGAYLTSTKFVNLASTFAVLKWQPPIILASGKRVLVDVSRPFATLNLLQSTESWHRCWQGEAFAEWGAAIQSSQQWRRRNECQHVAVQCPLLNFSNALFGQNSFFSFFRVSNPRIILILKCRGVQLIRHLNQGLKQPKKNTIFFRWEGQERKCRKNADKAVSIFEISVTHTHAESKVTHTDTRRHTDTRIRTHAPLLSLMNMQQFLFLSANMRQAAHKYTRKNDCAELRRGRGQLWKGMQRWRCLQFALSLAHCSFRWPQNL